MKRTGRVLGVAVMAVVVAACSADNSDVSGDGDGGADQDGAATADGGKVTPHVDAGGAGKDSGATTDASHDGAATGPTCSDKVQDQDETDVDCGGKVCPKCADTKKCDTGTDCTSGDCIKGYCGEASCKDGAMDGSETDVDCGGGSCPPCGDTLHCKVPADCVSDVCDPVALTCTAASCMDTVQNQGETAVDCGGPNCSPCADGQTCKTGTDCIDGVCNVTCQVPSCHDGVMNEGETDVDCGGPKCSPCGDGLKCGTNNDCVDGVCNVTCQAPTCNDGVQNEGETDVDCGGPKCGACGDGLKCKTGTDCIDKACGGGTCTAPSCTDGVMNGAETDVDCGGGTCPRCDVNKGCTANTDCAYNVCSAGNTCSTAVSCSGGGNGKNSCGPNSNEDCCTTLPVPGGTIGTVGPGKTGWSVSPYRLDKYEITVSRMRAFLAAKGWNPRGNPPNAGDGAHPNIPNSGWLSTWNNRLPGGTSVAAGQANVQKRAGIVGGNATQDSGTSGCYGGEDASTWTTNAGVDDQKAANCFDWYTLFAFCIWDGGYLPTDREWQFAGQGGTENRTYAFGSVSATVPKVTDWLPVCTAEPCQNPNTYVSTAYTGNTAPQTADAAYPMFLQAPGLYVVHGFCTEGGNRSCFSYTGTNANAGVGATNASHVAPPGQKLDIAKWGQYDMTGNLIEWTLDNSVNIVAGKQKTEPACVGADCANLDYVDYHDTNLDPNGNAIVGDLSTEPPTNAPGDPAYWRNYSYDSGQPNYNGKNYDLDAQYQQDGGRVMRGGSWEIAHPVLISNRYGDYPVYRSYYAAGARCARPY